MTFYYMTFFQCFIIILQLTQMTSFFRSDIVGLDDVKNKLKESIIYPALRPEVYKTFGVDPAKVSLGMKIIYIYVAFKLQVLK